MVAIEELEKAYRFNDKNKILEFKFFLNNKYSDSEILGMLKENREQLIQDLEGIKEKNYIIVFADRYKYTKQEIGEIIGVKLFTINSYFAGKKMPDYMKKALFYADTIRYLQLKYAIEV